MKKRLRKKLRLKEFYEMVLHVNGDFKYSLPDDVVDNFIDEMCIFVDDIKVTFIGVTNLETFFHAYMGLYKYKNRLTEEQIQLIKNKLNSFNFMKHLDFKIIKTTDMED